MDEKKIEPTEAMVDEAANAISMEEMDTPLHLRSDLARQNLRNRARTALSSALNHPDAPGLFADEDGLRAARGQGWDDAADWAIHNINDIDAERIRLANPYRPVRELPTEGGIVIVANDGHDDIEAIGPVSGATWRTKEAVLGADGRWYGVWRLDARTPAAASVAPEHITPGTWKVDDQ